MANIKEQIELDAMNATPGILPPGTKFQSYNGHNVINISKVDLSVHQTKALEKGLTFCPTPKRADKSEIWHDFKEFHRRLELVQFFKTTNEEVDLQITQSIIDFMNKNASFERESQEDRDPYENIQRPFRNKSSLKPNPSNGTLDTFKRAFRQNLLMSTNNKHIQPNLSKDEWKGLLELRKNPNIIIKKADKGSAVVIMDTVDYLREG